MTKGGSRRKRGSLADVAEVTGVSISTVSKVANGGGAVSDSTRAKIEAALAETGYVPTRLRRGSLTPVAMLVRNLNYSYVLDVQRGAVDAARRAGFDLCVGLCPDDRVGLGWIDELQAAGREAVIAVKSTLTVDERERLAAYQMPVVDVDPYRAVPEGAYSISSTNLAGGLSVTRHLLDLGHRRIALLAADPESLAGQDRVHGYRAAMSGAGVDLDPALILEGQFTFASGLGTATQLLGRKNRPTAIVASSDHQAMGVIEAARRAGLSVPADLSVTGFDDLAIAWMASPPLTTVRQPLEQIGAVAVETVASLLSGEGARIHHLELATSLVVRDSTAAPPGSATS